MTRSGRLQGENHKEYLRIPRIFDAEDDHFWVKRRRFRFFKQALNDANLKYKLDTMYEQVKNSNPDVDAHQKEEGGQ